MNIKNGTIAQTPPTSTDRAATPRSRARAARGAALILAASLALTACGGDDKGDNTVESQGSSAAPTAESTSSSSTDASPTPEASSSAKPGKPAKDVKGAGAAKPGIPAVTDNATDLKKEPVLAAGTGDAPSKLLTRDLVVGDGDKAVASDTVKVRYVGALYTDGTVFDSSWKGGMDPIEFPLSGVVPGFAQGIVGMKVGGRREIVIPAELGYGSADQGVIPPNSVLVFIVDLTKTGPGE